MLRKVIIKKAAIYMVLSLTLVVSLFPIYWLVLTSLQPKSELMHSPPIFFPHSLTLEHWDFAINEKFFAFINSLVVAATATVIGIILGALSGYAFARYRIGGVSLPVWILALKFFPPVAAIVPYFIMMNKLRIMDTQLAVIIPHLIITIPFAVWMMRGFIAEIPKELEEAAMIDGCSQLGVLRRVTLPLVAPGLVVTALFSFVWSWNDFMFALVLTRSHAITLPVAIAGMREAHGLMWGAVSATAALATLPILILALVLQKYLIRGLSFGAIK